MGKKGQQQINKWTRLGQTCDHPTFLMSEGYQKVLGESPPNKTYFVTGWLYVYIIDWISYRIATTAINAS